MKLKIKVVLETELEVKPELYPEGERSIEKIIKYEKENISENLIEFDWKKETIEIEEVK